MSEQMDKLVGEIANHIRALWVEKTGTWKVLANIDERQAEKETAEDIIARIGKAYARGEIDLPGEVGRGWFSLEEVRRQYPDSEKRYANWRKVVIETKEALLYADPGTVRIIALRPEEAGEIPNRC